MLHFSHSLLHSAACLHQELERYNRLLGVIRASLRDVQLAVKGEVVMTHTLEEVASDLRYGRVPATWMARSYPSLKPLASYVADLSHRLANFDKWIQHGPPPAFWLSGFFFTHSFLTSVLQASARRMKIAVDELDFKFEVLYVVVSQRRFGPCRTPHPLLSLLRHDR